MNSKTGLLSSFLCHLIGAEKTPRAQLKKAFYSFLPEHSRMFTDPCSRCTRIVLKPIGTWLAGLHDQLETPVNASFEISSNSFSLTTRFVPGRDWPNPPFLDLETGTARDVCVVLEQNRPAQYRGDDTIDNRPNHDNRLSSALTILLG